MRAETGVGPAMASGSHVWSGNWPLLPMMAMNSAIAAHISTVWEASGDSAQRLVARMLKLPGPKNRIEMPTSRPMSPVRVVQNALSAALELGFSSHQCPISANEQRPMISQPSRSWMVFSAMTRFSMPAVNRQMKAK